MIRSALPLPLLALLASACSSPPPASPPTATAASAPATAASAATAPPTGDGIDLAGTDRSVAPGDDFFAFANGTWLKSTEIPADRSTWGSGAMTAEKTAKRTAELVENAAKETRPSADAKKVGDYYASFMDEATIESKGLEPIKAALTTIAGIRDAKALATALGHSLRADVDILNATDTDTDNLFGLWVAQDLDDPSKYAAFVLQGGLEMPDRDYYVSAEPRMKETRDKYKAHIATVLGLAKIPDADKKAARILDLETKIAQVHATREETEDVAKGNNHWSKAELSKKASGLDWDAFLTAAQLDKQPVFVAWQPRAIAGISALVKSQPLDVWKDFLTFHAIEHHAAFLPKAFGDEAFAFYAKTLNGTPQQRERWKRAIDQTDHALGEVVGKLYVEKYFPASEKKRAEEMVKNIVAAFAKRIDTLDWMAPKTKAEAKAKLAALKVGVGYPDQWRDYSKLEVVRGEAFANFDRAELFDYRRNLAKLGSPVDRSEWVMNAQLVNAVNLPAMNALNFPAAILQPPSFDVSRPSAMDYGAMGAIIGHEICHSFDDTGALFDSKGKLNNWWTPEDLAHFHASAAALVAQFDAYQPFPDAHVNGKLTSAENIADVAGLNAAFDAYRIANGGKEGPSAQGLTGDQQFFVSFAQAWRFKAREAAARQRLLTDVHAPASYRAATVRNLDAWYTAYDVKPGQKLHLDAKSRVRIY